MAVEAVAKSASGILPMGLQGVLYLTDTSAENGAFVCIPGFHKRLGGWLQTLPPSMEHQPEFSLQSS